MAGHGEQRTNVEQLCSMDRQMEEDCTGPGSRDYHPRSIGKCQKGIWGGERMMIRHIKPKNVTIKIGQDHLITGGHQRVVV